MIDVVKVDDFTENGHRVVQFDITSLGQRLMSLLLQTRRTGDKSCARISIARDITPNIGWARWWTVGGTMKLLDWLSSAGANVSELAHTLEELDHPVPRKYQRS